jgi:hypothetical protein
MCGIPQWPLDNIRYEAEKSRPSVTVALVALQSRVERDSTVATKVAGAVSR